MKCLPCFVSSAICKHGIKGINSGAESAAWPPGRSIRQYMRLVQHTAQEGRGDHGDRGLVGGPQSQACCSCVLISSLHSYGVVTMRKNNCKRK